MRIGVRIPNWIGDAVLSVPAILRLIEEYEGDELFLIGRLAPIQVFVGIKGIKELVIIDDKGEGIIRTGKKLRRYKFDRMYLLTDSLSSAIIGWLSGAKQLYGYRKEGRRLFLSKSYDMQGNIHRSLKYLKLVTGGRGQFLRPKRLIFLQKGELLAAEEILDRYIDKKKRIIGINPNCSAESRKWGGEKFGELADRLVKDYNVIIFGSNKEVKYVTGIINGMKNSNLVINLSGKINLREYMAILSKLDLFVTNDSGPMHLANGVGTSVIALEGPADINETGVINESAYIKYINKNLSCSPCVKNNCPYKHNNCMKFITVEEVFRTVTEYMERL